MKLLVVTPAVDENHGVLGFIPTWLRKLAAKTEKLYVLTPWLDETTTLPDNVEVHDYSGVKEWDKLGFFTKACKALRWRLRWLALMFRLLPRVDGVFCHMYPSFTLMAGPCAKLLGKPVVTWYTHGHVSRRLRLASVLADRIVTASSESYRLKSGKVIVTGHGIDLERFRPETDDETKKEGCELLTAGRISPTKDLETVIRAVYLLGQEEGRHDIRLVVAGGTPPAATDDYLDSLKKLVDELGLYKRVAFTGPVPYTDMPARYRRSDLFVSPSRTGSVDKTVLEAMASGKPALACNETFRDVFGPDAETLLFAPGDAADLAGKISDLLAMDDTARRELGENLRAIVRERHDLDGLVDKLLAVFASLKKGKGSA
jgi:glycosyltransferase involved in cell wall biosynthesis